MYLGECAMKFVIALATVFLAAQAVSYSGLVREQWKTFKLTYRKQYSSEAQGKFRRQIFMDNLRKIEAHNQNFARGLVQYKLGMNQFGDLLHHEFVNIYNGYNKSGIQPRVIPKKAEEAAAFIESENVQIPDAVDWRQKGAVTPVKDQGACGSCWSFSATGSLEGQHFRETGKLVSLSEQNLVDCSTKYGNYGCSGGLMDNAFRYIKDNRGIDTEASYPYKAREGRCHYNPKTSGATDKGFVDIASGSERQLQAALATVGPVSVAIDSDHDSFQFYHSGVYDEPQCGNSKNDLGHAALVVGYGTTDDGKDYWIVKNSWGVSWGDEGYILMSRNKNNQCGIATAASYPLV